MFKGKQALSYKSIPSFVKDMNHSIKYMIKFLLWQEIEIIPVANTVS